MPRLFSYGTLQLPAVQQALFGRTLDGETDVVLGWRLAPVEIDDPTVVALSGKATHLVLRRGTLDDAVEGMIFDLTDAEVAAADAYETADYVRVATRSRCGVETFVYVAADEA